MNLFKNTSTQYTAEIYNLDEKELFETKSKNFKNPDEAFQWAESLKKDNTSRVLLYSKGGTVFLF